MTNCPKCETSLIAGKKFCTGCGAALTTPVARSAPTSEPSPVLKPVQAPALASTPATEPASPPRPWLRIILPAGLLLLAVIAFSVAWSVFSIDGFSDFRDDETLIAWLLTVLGLGAVAVAVLLFRRGRSHRP